MRESVFSPGVGEATLCPILAASIGHFKTHTDLLKWTTVCSLEKTTEFPVQPWMADSRMAAQILSRCRVI